jgi:hypothetical protein
MAAALRLLAEGPRALEPLDPDREQQLVAGQPRIGLIPFQRHPVEGVVGVHIEPFVETLLVDQPRLAHDEVDQFLIGGDRILQGSLSDHAHVTSPSS